MLPYACILFKVTRQYASTSPELLAEALFDIAAARGLEAASVREVAAAAGVSIGAVQHHFATKDEMFGFAFAQLVSRVRARVTRIDPSAPLPDRLAAALRQLLPLDRQREREARVMTAFAVRASTSPALAAIQREILAGIRRELAGLLHSARVPRPELRAILLLAAVDGLTLDMLSSASLYSPDEVADALDEQIGMVLSNT
ncbi:MAG: TetR family transcriptional regulator [Aldersonia sp.]|nr:TetR family transcriptional regulator [Aldersonia sp.]